VPAQRSAYFRQALPLGSEGVALEQSRFVCSQMPGKLSIASAGERGSRSERTVPDEIRATLPSALQRFRKHRNSGSAEASEAKDPQALLAWLEGNAEVVLTMERHNRKFVLVPAHLSRP
jgi:hypothetical protein